MTTATHTPGPFFVKHGDEGFFEIMDGPNSQTANTLCTRFHWKERADEMRANGEFIVTACNAHDQLVAENAALREQLERRTGAANSSINAALMMPDPVRPQLVAALNLARESLDPMIPGEQYRAILLIISKAIAAAGAP